VFSRRRLDSSPSPWSKIIATNSETVGSRFLSLRHHKIAN
jgi:hypothetical protein